MTCEDLDSDLPPRRMTKTDILNILKPIAQEIYVETGWLPSMTASQVIHESGWLKYVICNNCLGIKCTNDAHVDCCKGSTKEWEGDHYEVYDLWFKAFETINACIKEGYVHTIMLPRYEETRKCKDFYTASNQIRLDGYATGPKYHLSLRDVILQNKLNLWDWGHGPEENITDNFKWKESASNARHRRYKHLSNNYRWRRVIEPPKELWSNVVEVATEVQKLRDYLNVPLKINSWYRTPEYNASLLGSASKSQHLLGKAVDVALPRRHTARDMMRLAKRMTNFKGFGIGRNYIHMDTRTKPAIWYY